MKDIRKLQDWVFTAANSGKMRGEMLVRAIQMAKEIACRENIGEDWYVTELFHRFSDVRDNVHKVWCEYMKSAFFGVFQLSEYITGDSERTLNAAIDIYNNYFGEGENR